MSEWAGQSGSEESVGHNGPLGEPIDWADLIERTGPKLVAYFRRRGIPVTKDDIDDGLATALTKVVPRTHLIIL